MKLFKDSYWIRSGFYSIAHRFSVLIFGFGSFFFLIRYFPKEQFGAWALFITITTLVEMSRNGLIQNALIKLMHASLPDALDRVVTASWIINILYSLTVYLLLVILAGPLSRMFRVEEIGPMFYYYGLTVALLIPFSQFNYLQQANFSFSGIFWSTALRQGTFFTTILIVYFSQIHITLVTLVQIQIVCTFAGLICAFFSAKKYVSMRWQWSNDSAKKVLTFGKYVMGTNICSLLFKSVDQLLLGFLLTPATVAIYNSAMRVSNLIEYPATSVAEIVYPQSTSRIQKEGDSAVKPLYEKSVGFTLALTLPVVLLTLVLADQIILLIAGRAYMEAATILRITILFGVFTPFNRQFGTVMDSSARPQLNLKVLAAGLVLNGIINAVCIYFFGIVGAACGTLISYVILFLTGFFFVKKIFGVELKNVITYMLNTYRDFFNHGKKLIMLQ